MGWLIKSILLFCLSIVKISALNLFPKKSLVIEKHKNVTLICETKKDYVTWKRQDVHGTVDIHETVFEIPKGRNLTVCDLQEDITGNYTCWSDEGLEDYTYLLLDKTKEAAVFNISCTAETFSCTKNITCAWTSDEFTAFRLRNTRDNGDWVSETVDGVFHLPHSTNLYAEESERLLITGEAISSCCYLKTDHSFYLRDIVKPAGPNISTCRIANGEIVEVEVKPPSSWPQPHSFFPLKHQIEYEIRDNGKLETHEWEGSKVEVKGVISKLRVRCRDPLLLSQWSEWTAWEKVSKRKGRKCIKTVKTAENTGKRNKSKKQERKRQKKWKHSTWANF
ncbi:interleukin-12 subunit beta-like [Myxocyprinus asiaticus]|uniref:interleukin-12 subunit beta-like n=1 Tax=Myxocyprinus asiaticus TaxID=70543 RepID=UPI0022238AB0|nr:interleukin-12 subunit beta-like [Myxocyprinus asiaticus]